MDGSTNDGTVKKLRIIIELARLNVGGRECEFRRCEDLTCDSAVIDSCRSIEETLVARKHKCRALIDTRYAAIETDLPGWMRSPMCHCVMVCADALLVRHQRIVVNKPDAELCEDVVLFHVTDKSAVEVSRAFSDGFVLLHEPDAEPPSIDEAPSLSLNVMDQDGTTKKQLLNAKMAVVHPLRAPDPLVPFPHRMFITTGEFELRLVAVEVCEETGQKRPMVIRTHQRARVGWEAFEVLCTPEAEVWTDVDPAQWAEFEMLERLASKNLDRQLMDSIDSRRAGRLRYRDLFAEYDKVLRTAGSEAPLQDFLERHPEFLDPTHILVIPQKVIGTHRTDFVLRRASGAYTLVELESPTRALFKADGGQRAELTHAIDQTRNWKRFIEDNLKTVRDELGLKSIEGNPDCLIVIGRDNHLDEAARRKLILMRSEAPRTTILTYDQLRAHTLATVENLFGPIRDEPPHTEIYFPDSLSDA